MKTGTTCSLRHFHVCVCVCFLLRVPFRNKIFNVLLTVVARNVITGEEDHSLPEWLDLSGSNARQEPTQTFPLLAQLPQGYSLILLLCQAKF